MAKDALTWTGSLHQTFRLIPQPSGALSVFLSSDGLSPAEVLSALPYEASRSRGEGAGEAPDAKRYRDARAVYQSVGLVYEEPSSGLVRVTELGHALRRWLAIFSLSNLTVLGRHAAYALASCQLRNPTGSGRVYHPSVEAFPFSYMWRAMLKLDWRITSDELNRALFYAIDEEHLADAVDRISSHRQRPDSGALREEVIVGARNNDRIVPWVSLASFGYSLIMDKRDSDKVHYMVRPEARRLLQEAAEIRHSHKEFSDTSAYVQHVSAQASLPKDVR